MKSFIQLELSVVRYFKNSTTVFLIRLNGKRQLKSLFLAVKMRIWSPHFVVTTARISSWAGKNFYANFNCVILDAAEVTIGDNVLLGPNVQILTAGHPLDVKGRVEEGVEFGTPINVGDNVWLGGGVIICPGVTIGENSVIGAGSVVTKDIPANVVAVGNPCKVLKAIDNA